MSTEAFLWRYDQGELESMPLDDILSVFRPHTDSFDATTGILHLRFDDAANSCDAYLGKGAATSGVTNGILISRPVRHAQLWHCVLEIMRTGNVVLFFSDCTTPLFCRPDAADHFPTDLLDSLGIPRFVETPEDILRSFGN